MFAEQSKRVKLNEKRTGDVQSISYTTESFCMSVVCSNVPLTYIIQTFYKFIFCKPVVRS